MDRDAIVAAARDTAAAVRAVPALGYRNWSQLVLPMIENTTAAAKYCSARILLLGSICNYGLDALPMLKEDSPVQHQNQPPDGTRPLRRRYVTRLP